MSKNSIIDHQEELEQRRLNYIDEITRMRNIILKKAYLNDIIGGKSFINWLERGLRRK
jgi:hypothetical protein